ncbi:hypothetical protein WICPIJ_001655 [Wickerhamomyces pijperi]|uniref:Uncharacterized protein n=1 Tax=Wickerhamomyces pijperi TaxID=599730 RepID=A0A9P8TPP8_WICPI|nr:hypothetical protein WICPIJ_001655 [Wickerhamomyces pijperi]
MEHARLDLLRLNFTVYFLVGWEPSVVPDVAVVFVAVVVVVVVGSESAAGVTDLEDRGCSGSDTTVELV